MKKNLEISMGTLRLAVGLIWAALSIAGMIYGDKTIQAAQEWMDLKMSPVIESLGTVHTILIEAGDVLTTVETSLATVGGATTDVALTLTDTRPLVDETAQVLVYDVPETIEGVQDSMPSLIETAATVDETLAFLSAFKMVVPIPFGDDVDIGLGVDYNPEVPLDQALEDLNDNLEGLPEDLRALEDNLDTADANLLILSDDLSALADDLSDVNQQMEDINPQLDDVADDVQALRIALEDVQERGLEVLPTVRMVYMVLLSLILLGQVPAVYAGVILLREGPRLAVSYKEEQE
ncbi:MAG: hypothetical protein U9Q82_04760 [Chloroflexota bacterium]|nr:hypothetical protein [Chloroflexota bacterium]